MEPLLDVKNLTTRFYTPDGAVFAVNGVDFHVNKGETLGIVGESGCGKTVSVLSTMRLIRTPPGKIISGEVLFEGKELMKMNMDKIRKIRGKKIAMIFQDPMTSLNPVLTINKQVSEVLQLHMKMTMKKARNKVIELLDMVGISEAVDRINDYPHQFSGGMRQRAMIAMALACNPQLIIADEPTTALDVTIQAQVIDIVKRLSDELGTAVIWITHDLGIIAGLADRVNVMYAGYFVETASCKDVYGDPKHPYTLGLLGSIPRLDEIHRKRLTSIEGSPPDLIDMQECCPFVPRCTYRIDKCFKENPELRTVAPDHRIACWIDIETATQKEVA